MAFSNYVQYLVVISLALKTYGFSNLPKSSSVISHYDRHTDGRRTVTRVIFNSGIHAREVLLANHGNTAPYYKQVTDGIDTILHMTYSREHILDNCQIFKDKERVSAFLRKLNGTSKVEAGETLEVAREFQEEMRTGFEVLKQQCEKLQRAVKMATRRSPVKRHRRAVYFSDMIYPGTRWCGKGNVSQTFEDLGEARETDKCCRSHDYCNYTIPGFETDWDLFNYRLTTVSHCVCDEIFLNCLKSVHNDVADLVGDMYFNIMETPCFVFAPVKVCKKRAWWGRCEKYGYNMEASFRDPLRYT